MSARPTGAMPAEVPVDRAAQPPRLLDLVAEAARKRGASERGRKRGAGKEDAARISPRRSPPAAGEGRAAGEKECQGRGSKEARAGCPIVSADAQRVDRKSTKMPEWGLT